MAEINLDYKQLLNYGSDLIAAREKASEQAQKAFLRKEGSKLLRYTKTAVRGSGMDYRGHIKPAKYKNSAHYYATIKRGKVYRYAGAWAVRAFSYAPHAHLLEYGHKFPNGTRARAFQPFETGRSRMESVYQDDVYKWYEEVFAKLR